MSAPQWKAGSMRYRPALDRTHDSAIRALSVGSPGRVVVRQRRRRPSARPRRRRRRHPLRRPGRGHGLRPSGLASHQLRALRAEHAPDPDAPPGSLHSSLFRPFPPCVSCPFLSFLRWRSGPAGRGRLHWEVAPPFEKARALRVAGLCGPRPKANGTLYVRLHGGST